jgi:hypothetical protein
MQFHYRTPNHLNPGAAEMARSIGYKPMMAGEDADYSFRLFETYPDMREAFIDKFLYTTCTERRGESVTDGPDVT